MSANISHAGHHRSMMTVSNSSNNTTGFPQAGVLRATNDHEDAMFTSGFRRPFYAHTVRTWLKQRGLFNELIDIILEEMGEFEWVEIPGTRRPHQSPVQSSLASTPMADGTCHLLRLPDELLRDVFSASLPSRSEVIDPGCGIRTEYLERRDPRPNRVDDLMVLNRKICRQVAEMVYEERTFGIHVHQGQKNAGIEFLHVGRQPLQYQTESSDGRFIKFRPGEIFGFSRLKKLEIRIFPDDGLCRHTAINTYYMLLAIVRLLGRDDDPKNRINSLAVVFEAGYSPPAQGQGVTMAGENPWWDAENTQPRETSFHGISDIQLMLQPFAQLFGVHNVAVELPPTVAEHQPTIAFVQALKRCMQGLSQNTTFNNANLNAQLEATRAAHEDYMFRSLYGGSTAGDDMLEDVRDEDDDNDNDDDGDDHSHDSDEDNRPDDNDDEDDEDDDDDDYAPDANMLKGEDGEQNKRELSPSSTDVEGGGKRVHFSDDTSSGSQSGPSETSHTHLGASRDALTGNLSTATEWEIDFVDQFAEVFRTTQGRARHWLSTSRWDLETATTSFLNSPESARGLATDYDDATNSMVAGGPPGPLQGRRMRAGRNIDHGASPTRSGRADGHSARVRSQQRRLLESYLLQEDEAQAAKLNGKGKGRSRRIEVDEDGNMFAQWRDPSNYDDSISKWNSPSNFPHQEDDHDPSDTQDTGMAEDGHGTNLPAPTITNTADGSAGDYSPAENDQLVGHHSPQLSELNSQGFANTNNDAGVFTSLQSDDSVLLFRDYSRVSRTDRHQPQDRSLTQPMGSGHLDSSTARPRTFRHPRQFIRTPRNAHAPPEQSSNSMVRQLNDMQEELRRFEAQLATPSPSSADMLESFTITPTPRQRPWSVLTGGRQQLLTNSSPPSPPPPPPQPTIPANTVDDYPQWAGTSYWSVPSAVVASVPASDVSTTTSSATNPPALQYAAPIATDDFASDPRTHPSRARVARDSHSTQDDAYATSSTTAAIAATDTATTVPVPNTAPTRATSSQEYRANQEYWADFCSSFEDAEYELLNGGDSEGEL